MNEKQKYAEELPYYQTSTSSADAWMDKACTEIKRYGGKILNEGFVREQSGRAAFLLEFQIADDNFHLVWQVLKSKSGNDKAAKIQAATTLYHDVKAKCLRAAWVGARAAFLEWLMLPGGQTAGQATTPELQQAIPDLFRPRLPALTSGDIVDGESREVDE